VLNDSFLFCSRYTLKYLNVANWPSTPRQLLMKKFVELVFCSTFDIDPFLPVTFLQTGQSAKSRFCELEGHKAAIGDLTQSAKTGL
jgi:hypothetical protein